MNSLCQHLLNFDILLLEGMWEYVRVCFFNIYFCCRDGQEKTIDANTVTVGDVILLRGGDSIPADVRLIEVANLTVDNSALTGNHLRGFAVLWIYFYTSSCWSNKLRLRCWKIARLINTNCIMFRMLIWIKWMNCIVIFRIFYFGLNLVAFSLRRKWSCPLFHGDDSSELPTSY